MEYKISETLLWLEIVEKDNYYFLKNHLSSDCMEIEVTTNDEDEITKITTNVVDNYGYEIGQTFNSESFALLKNYDDDLAAEYSAWCCQFEEFGEITEITDDTTELSGNDIYFTFDCIIEVQDDFKLIEYCEKNNISVEEV